MVTFNCGRPVVEGTIHVKTYDKRDAFKFEIINYPDLSGNIPKKPAYGVFSSQVIRFAQSCSRKEDLINRIRDLINKLTKKNFEVNILKNTLRKCMKNHHSIANKIGQNAIKQILNMEL